MFLHVFACLQVFLAASPLYCWLKPFCLALLKLPHSKRRLAPITHLFLRLCLYLCVYCISFVHVFLVSLIKIPLFYNGDASSSFPGFKRIVDSLKEELSPWENHYKTY